MPFRQRRMTVERFLFDKWGNVSKGVENENMSQLHKFRFEPMDELGRGIVTIDDKPIKCRGFELKHYVDEFPSANIEVVCVPQIEENAIISVSNKEEIAALMEREEFEEFCKIWEKING